MKNKTNEDFEQAQESFKRKLGSFYERLEREKMGSGMYPITVERQTFTHKNGTKSYHLMIVRNATGHAVFINRWGKIGQFGDLQVTPYNSHEAASQAWDRKEREKTRGGYGATAATIETIAETPAQLPAAISLAVFAKMGPDAVKHLDPSYDTSSMREIDPPRLDEDGKLTGIDTTRKADISEALAAEKERQRIEDENAYKDNPLFGLF